MNIVQEAAIIAASTDAQLAQVDQSYEQAMLERFYHVRAVEIDERKAELTYWQQQAQAEQEEALDASPDEDFDLHEETESDASDYWWSSRGV